MNPLSDIIIGGLAIGLGCAFITYMIMRGVERKKISNERKQYFRFEEEYQRFQGYMDELNIDPEIREQMLAKLKTERELSEWNERLMRSIGQLQIIL